MSRRARVRYSTGLLLAAVVVAVGSAALTAAPNADAVVGARNKIRLIAASATATSSTTGSTSLPPAARLLAPSPSPSTSASPEAAHPTSPAPSVAPLGTDPSFCGSLTPLFDDAGALVGCTHGDDHLHGPDGAFSVSGLSDGDRSRVEAITKSAGTSPTQASAVRSAAGPSPSGIAVPSGIVAPQKLPCPAGDDGTSGNRVAAYYVRETGEPSTYTASFATWARAMASADAIVQRSAAKVGGRRHIRWAHPGDCTVQIGEIVLPAGSLANIQQTMNAMLAAGYRSGARKYLIFTDRYTYCGIASLWYDDVKTSGAYTNASDGRLYGFARVDHGPSVDCWAGFAVAHELFHNFGAVQTASPNATSFGHCVDEWDTMCYNDGALKAGQTLRYVCTMPELLDCGNDDYFALSPNPATWLGTHFNTADSSFLTATASVDQPIANSDVYELSPGPPQTLDVLANDVLPAGAPASPNLLVGSVYAAQSGSTITYSPQSAPTLDVLQYDVSAGPYLGSRAAILVVRKPDVPVISQVFLGGSSAVVLWGSSPINYSYDNVEYRVAYSSSVEVQRSDDNGATWNPVGNSTTNFAQDGGISAAKTYLYRARVVSSLSTTAWSQPYRFVAPDRLAASQAPIVTNTSQPTTTVARGPAPSAGDAPAPSPGRAPAPQAG